LGIGNSSPDFTYSAGDRELLDIFGKQVTIAIENDILARRVEKLEIRDMLTGLYNEQYLRSRLDEEIKRAIMYQRPCGIILVKINNFSTYQNRYGQIACETALKKVASCLGSSLTNVERIARFADYEFAIVLPEKNKRSCEKTAEELKQKVEYLFKDEAQADKRLSISVAVAENPLDGVSAQELILSAQELLGP
jgi:diguanylate cyclase (GGDEF)-like protein